MESRESITESQRPARARASFGYRRAAMRRIRHPELGVILVYELDPAPGQRGIRTLIYESESVSSCVERVPPEWPRLSDDELLALVR